MQPRIGDAEREQAIGYLQEHMAQGRLDRLEFDERLTQAFAARTAAELQPLFDDLPEPRPGTALTPIPPAEAAAWTAPTGAHVVPAADATPDAREQMPRAVTVTLAAAWPAAILLSFATGFQHWWIWVVAGLLTYVLRQAFPPEPAAGNQQGPPAVERRDGRGRPRRRT